MNRGAILTTSLHDGLGCSLKRSTWRVVAIAAQDIAGRHEMIKAVCTTADAFCGLDF